MAAEAAPAGKITAILDWHERWFESPSFHGCLFQHALAEYGAPDHPVFDAVSRQKQDLKTRLHEILARALAEERATILAHLGQGKLAIASARETVSALLASVE